MYRSATSFWDCIVVRLIRGTTLDPVKGGLVTLDGSLMARSVNETTRERCRETTRDLLCALLSSPVVLFYVQAITLAIGRRA